MIFILPLGAERILLFPVQSVCRLLLKGLSVNNRLCVFMFVPSLFFIPIIQCLGPYYRTMGDHLDQSEAYDMARMRAQELDFCLTIIF